MASRRSQLERLLDVSVYAPLGFLLTRDEVVGDLAQAGRKQIAFSRSLGRAALKGLANGPAASGAAKKPATAPAAAPTPPTGAVDGYEKMTAKQIVTLLGACSSEEAAWIATAEAAGKNRVTVLRATEARD